MAENCDFEQSIYKDCQYQLCEIDWRGIWKYKLLKYKQETKVLSHFGMSLFVFKVEGSNLSILPFKNNNFVLRHGVQLRIGIPQYFVPATWIHNTSKFCEMFVFFLDWFQHFKLFYRYSFEGVNFHFHFNLCQIFEKLIKFRQNDDKHKQLFLTYSVFI